MRNPGWLVTVFSILAMPALAQLASAGAFGPQDNKDALNGIQSLIAREQYRRLLDLHNDPNKQRFLDGATVPGGILILSTLPAPAKPLRAKPGTRPKTTILYMAAPSKPHLEDTNAN